MLKAILLCFVITYVSFPVANGDPICYSCVMNGGEADHSCETNPAGVTTSNPTVKCPTKYCVIERLEYVDPAGQIFTFYRGCTDDGTNGMTVDGPFKKYRRVCTSDRCNDWDGIASGPGGGSGGGGGGGGSGGSGSSGSGGSGNGSDKDDVWIVDGSGFSRAGNRRVDLCVAFITLSVVMKLYM